MTGQPDLFGGVCQGRSGSACMRMDGGMVCLCSLVGHHGGQCKCSNCGLSFSGTLFTPPPAAARRDTALAQVAEGAGPSFLERVREVLAGMDQPEFTGEDLRVQCVEAGVEPHHHNAWGATINTLVRSGQLVPTGDYAAMRTSKSHARRTPIYHLA